MAVSSIGFRILPFHGRELGSIPSTAATFKDCKDSHAIEGLTVLYLRLEIETYKKPNMAIPDGVSVGTVRRALCNPYWAPAWDVPGSSVSSSGQDVTLSR